MGWKDGGVGSGRVSTLGGDQREVMLVGVREEGSRRQVIGWKDEGKLGGGEEEENREGERGEGREEVAGGKGKEGEVKEVTDKK